MIDITNKEQCSGCGACAAACPKQCIELKTDGEGFWYPVIDRDRCISCGRCDRVCPIRSPLSKPQDFTSKAYAANNLNTVVRMQSSSGGVFTPLAEAVLKDGGVVFGAAMSEDQRTAHHIAVTERSELWKLRGSKYLQSSTDGAYHEVQAVLNKGRKVLFSGTPCQVAGLQAFLGAAAADPNLLCVDFVCHGVPSPKVWQHYVSYRESCADAAARRTNFRYKVSGWKAFSLSLEFANDTSYTQKVSTDLFMQSFLRDVSLRPSCYACAFKDVHRSSDITLADFWGVNKVAPRFDDDRGTSLVITHSHKGDAAFRDVMDRMNSIRVDLDQSVRMNPATTCSAAKPATRSDFFEHLDEIPFDELVHTFAPSKRTLKGSVVALLDRIGVGPILRRLRDLRPGKDRA